ncbi:MAG: response regulator [Deltaproteobacteria bacterium]
MRIYGTNKIKVLVVEDDTSTQLLYDKGLFNQVFDKKLVASGEEALLVHNEWHPDIIILDIQLPEMNGDQVLKEIRTNIEDKKTTIVMATSMAGREDVMSCVKYGIEGYIVKPFSVQEIALKILGYYAKKEQDCALKADARCRDILQQSQTRLLLAKEDAKTKENTRGLGSESAADKKTEAAAEEKPKD